MPRLFGSEESRAGEMKFLRLERGRIEAYAAYASVLVLVAYLVVSVVYPFLWFGIGQGRNYTPEGKRIPRDIGESQFLAFFLILTGVASLAFRIPGWRQKVLPVVLLLVYWTAVYMALVALRRYSHPVMPYLMMLSAYTVYRLVGGGRLIDRVAGETH